MKTNNKKDGALAVLASVLLSLFLSSPAISQTGVGIDIPNPLERLHVNGAVKIGTDLNNTNGAPNGGAGTIRWNGTYFQGWDGSQWVSFGGVGTAWNLTGNNATNPATNFLGTTDGQPFRIKVNNQNSGYIDFATPFSASFGYQALKVNTGANNAAFGYQALQANTSGQNNTAVGKGTLGANTTGSYNTAVGDALKSNTTGINNTAVGDGALIANTTSNHNTAIGGNALTANSTGSGNSALGVSALQGNTTGIYNSSLGTSSLRNSTTGDGNTGVGYEAMTNNATGSYNTSIGYQANVSSNNLTNATAIGANAVVGASNSLVLGNNSNVGIGTTTPSAKLQVVGNAIIGQNGQTNNGWNAVIAGGTSNTITGGQAFVTGSGNNASGDIAFISGAINSASGFASFSANRDNTSSGNHATTFGSNNIAPSFNEFVLGSYATTYTPASTTTINAADRVFVVGNGTGNANRSNALTIYKNGTVNINDAYDLPTADGSSNYVMKTNGAGVAAWVDPNTLITDNDTQNTLDQAYDEGGAGVGRVITADNGAVRINGDDGLIVTGTFGSGDAVEVTGAGTRMFFNPKKAAFRAGKISGTEWDDASIGNSSTALGESTTASGTGSTALGVLAQATGNYSTAIGGNTTASGQWSTSIGSFTTASAQAATALGTSTVASGNNSTAMGSASIASGTTSTALGNSTTAKSAYETVVGTFNTDYSPANASGFNANDRLFVVGNGTGTGSFSSNALTIYKSGKMNINDAYDMPVADGAANYVMKTDGSGTISWADPNSLVSGDDLGNHSATQNIQLNDFYLSNDGGNEGVRVDDNGNVGVGTSTPSQKLCIQTNANTGLSIPILVRNTGAINGSGTGSGIGFNNHSAGSNPKSVIYNERVTDYGLGKLHFLMNNTGDVSAATLSDARMTILSNGNVGVATTSPSAKLEVAGQVKITGGTPGTNKVLTSDAAGLASWIDPNTLVSGDNLGNHIATQNVRLNANWLSNDGGNEGIRIDNGGNVGIGEATPSATLDVAGTLQLNIGTPALNKVLTCSDANGNATWVDPNTLVNGDNLGNHIATQNVRLNGNWLSNDGGNEGIKVADNGDIQMVTNTITGSAQSLYLAGHIFLAPYGGGNICYLQARRSDDSGTTELQIRTSNGGSLTNSMRITGDGNVGIGTTSPSYKLDVSGTGRFTGDVYAQSRVSIGNNGNGASAPLYVNGSTISTPSSARAYFNTGSGLYIVQDVSASGFIQVEAAGYYWANGGGYVATSDARIKNIIGQTDTETDLNTLSQIEITDYTYIDQIQNGTTQQKKVIAQQVQSVFPNAITTMKGIIPSVYATAASVTASGNTTEVVTTKPHGFATGDRVKLILEQGSEKMMEVAVVDGNTFTVAEPLEGNVFVYGKHVDDLLTVDYDALTTLNISATQEIVKRLMILEKENAILKATNQSNEARLQRVEEQLGIDLKAQR